MAAVTTSPIAMHPLETQMNDVPDNDYDEDEARAIPNSGDEAAFDEDYDRALEEALELSVKSMKTTSQTGNEDTTVHVPLRPAVMDQNANVGAVQVSSRKPPIPYTVNLLFGSQSHYKCYSSCSFIAVLFVQYLLNSRWRDVKHIEAWLKIGCYLYNQKIHAIKELQSKNPNTSENFVAPRLAADVLETTRERLRFIEELSGVTRTSPMDDSVDQEFVRASAFITLDKAIRRLFMFALREPIAATYLSSTEYIHAIGMRWQQEVKPEDRDRLASKLCPGSPDAFDGKDSPQLEELDEAFDMKKMFLIDLIDSHLNQGWDGMPAQQSNLSAASGVWIEFSSLCDLRDYLLARYPPINDSATNKHILVSRKNAFDMVVWQTPSPDGKILGSVEVDRVLSDSRYQRWADEADRRIAHTRRYGYSY